MNERKTLFSFLVFVASVIALECVAAEEETCAYDPWYTGVSGGLLLPGNGNSLRRAADVSLRAGRYLSDTFAVEACVATTPRAAADGAGRVSLVSAGAGALLHMTHFTFYDRLFGSERFDPFITFGAHATFASGHVFADRSHRSAFGPYAGFGAFYHLTDSWSVRAEARAALCCDSPCGMLYGVSVGLQYSFGAE